MKVDFPKCGVPPITDVIIEKAEACPEDLSFDVTIHPSPATVCGVTQLAASVVDSQGEPSIVPLLWEVVPSGGDPGALMVVPPAFKGQVMGLYEGQAVVRATVVGGLGTAEALIAVTGSSGNCQLLVSPAPLEIETGQVEGLTARITNGTVTVDDPPVGWESDFEAVAQVTEFGAVTGRTPGRTSVRAYTIGGTLTGVSEVTVAPRVDLRPDRDGLELAAGETAQAEVSWSGPDAGADTLSAANVTWTSDKPDVVAVQTSRGNPTELLGKSCGTAMITASAVPEVRNPDGAYLTFEPAREVLIGVAVTPCDYFIEQPEPLWPGQTVTLQLMGRQATEVNGQTVIEEVPIVADSWSHADDSIARVDSSGVVTAVGYGQTEIAARHGTIEVAVTVTVLPDVYLGLYVDAQTGIQVIIPRGGDTTVSAAWVGTDATSIDPPSVTWTVGEGIVSFDVLDGQTIQLWGETAGNTTLVASAPIVINGVMSPPQVTSISVTVIEMEVASIEIYPSFVVGYAGDTVPLSINIKDKDGNQIGSCPSRIIWTLPPGDVAALDLATNTLTFVSQGMVTITATCEGASDTIDVVTCTDDWCIDGHYLSDCRVCHGDLGIPF